MKVRYLLDTNIISEAFRNPDGKVAARIGTLPDSEICTSIIVAAELRFGAAKRNSQKLADKIENALLRMTILPLEPPADRTYAQIRTDLEKRGRPIGANDMLIAAQALSLGLIVVTDNVSEFRRVRGLKVENWLR